MGVVGVFSLFVKIAVSVWWGARSKRFDGECRSNVKFVVFVRWWELSSRRDMLVDWWEGRGVRRIMYVWGR